LRGKGIKFRSQDAGRGKPDGEYFFQPNLVVFKVFIEKNSQQLEE